MNEVGVNEKLFSFLAILLAIVLPFVFTVKVLLVRMNKTKYPVVEWNRDAGFFDALFSFILIILLYQQPEAEFVTWKTWVFGFLSGALTYTGK